MARARTKPPLNPFYPMLVLAGVAFTVTAFAYGLMTVREAGSSFTVDEHPLMRLMRERGTDLLLWEVAALATFSIAAMATDRFWSRRRPAAQSTPPIPSSSDKPV